MNTVGEVNDNGIAFVQKCIDMIESRGMYVPLLLSKML